MCVPRKSIPSSVGEPGVLLVLDFAGTALFEEAVLAARWPTISALVNSYVAPHSPQGTWQHVNPSSLLEIGRPLWTLEAKVRGLK